MSELVPLDAVPAIIQRERRELAELTTPLDMAQAERRAAAIAELTKRAGLSVPIQNEATFYRAEALERLAGLIDAGQANGQIAKPGERSNVRAADISPLPIPRQRVTEARALAETGARAEAEAEAAKTPDKPVSMNDILRRAKRRQRETKVRERNAEAEHEARTIGLHHELVVADVHTWRPLDVNAIVTDPPYIGDAIPLYAALRDFAVDVLPEGGALAVMTWQAIMPDVIRALEHPQLAYRWTICWRYGTQENTVDHARRIFDNWKPILVYHKGAMPVDATMINDEIVSDTSDKTAHAWGQSIPGFRRLVKATSTPGQTICDPFLGGGTTAIAALAEARNFAGADIAPEAVETTRARLSG
jgi:site-specific DNA-methyltransferase (adenine-specific)